MKNSPVARRWQSAAGGVRNKAEEGCRHDSTESAPPRSEHHNRKVKSIRRTRAKVPGHVLDSCVACGTCSLRSERAVAGGRVKRRVGKNVRVRLSSITPEEVGTDGRFRARVDEAVRRGCARSAITSRPSNLRWTIGRGCRARCCMQRSIRANRCVSPAPTSCWKAARRPMRTTALVKKDRPTIGEILNHGKYDSFKGSLTGPALRKGYFDADMTKASSAWPKICTRRFGISISTAANVTASAR